MDRSLVMVRRRGVLPRLMDQEQRRPVTNRAMGSHFIVLGLPFFNLFVGVVQIQERVSAEPFQSNSGVEALHIRIIRHGAFVPPFGLPIVLTVPKG
jgi:hypothetical protein